MKIKWWYIALFVALLLAIISPIASSSPDGLERVAEDQDILEKAHESMFTIVPDYMFPGIENEAVATIIAGLLGTLLVFAATIGIAGILKTQSRHEI